MGEGPLEQYGMRITPTGMTRYAQEEEEDLLADTLKEMFPDKSKAADPYEYLYAVMSPDLSKHFASIDGEPRNRISGVEYSDAQDGSRIYRIHRDMANNLPHANGRFFLEISNYSELNPNMLRLHPPAASVFDQRIENYRGMEWKGI